MYAQSWVWLWPKDAFGGDQFSDFVITMCKVPTKLFLKAKGPKIIARTQNLRKIFVFLCISYNSLNLSLLSYESTKIQSPNALSASILGLHCHAMKHNKKII